MKINSALAKVLFCAAITAIMAGFVHAYSALLSNLMQYGYRLSMSVLPLPTSLYYHYSWLGYLIPVAALATLFLKFKEQDAQAATREVFLYVLFFMAMLWLLGCIIAWQLPHYIPVAFIK